jgi:hypothetical protein
MTQNAGVLKSIVHATLGTARPPDVTKVPF